MAVARMAFAMRAVALRGSSAGLAFPAPGAAIDLDFVNRRYWWGGASKLEANFTTFNLNGSTFGVDGLTPSTTVDITLSLSGLGTFLPGVMAGVVKQTSSPGAAKVWASIDDGTTTERCALGQSSASPASINVLMVDNSTTQVSTSPGNMTAMNTKLAIAASFALNNTLSSGNGVSGTADTACTLPTVTTLRIGKSTGASSNLAGSIGRVLLFTATKTQAELNDLTTALQT